MKYKNIPYEKKIHFSQNDAFNYRIKKIKELILKFKNDPNIIIYARKIVGKLNPERENYDYVLSKKLYEYLKKNIPFRKDINNTELIQYPEFVIKYGGDCDCLVVLAGSCLESLGIDCKLAVSKQNNNQYDHIFLIISSINKIFDLTTPFPYDMEIIGLYKGIKVL